MGETVALSPALNWNRHIPDEPGADLIVRPDIADFVDNGEFMDALLAGDLVWLRTFLDRPLGRGCEGRAYLAKSLGLVVKLYHNRQNGSFTFPVTAARQQTMANAAFEHINNSDSIRTPSYLAHLAFDGAPVRYSRWLGPRAIAGAAIMTFEPGRQLIRKNFFRASASNDTIERVYKHVRDAQLEAGMDILSQFDLGNPYNILVSGRDDSEVLTVLDMTPGLRHRLDPTDISVGDEPGDMRLGYTGVDKRFLHTRRLLDLRIWPIDR